MSRTYQPISFEPALQGDVPIMAPTGMYATTTSSTVNLSHFSELKERLEEIAQLRNNWDGYGGASISEGALKSARQIIEAQMRFCQSLSLPDVTPTSSGTIALEWQSGQGEAVVELGETKVSGFVKDGQKHKILLSGECKEVSEYLSNLIDAVLNVAIRHSEPISRIESSLTDE